MPIPAKIDKNDKRSAKERVYDVLREWIVRGILLPGEQLYDAKLAEYFGTSRTPVREAILQLESQGLTAIVPGKSTIVTEINARQIRDWYIPLAHLQALSAELACDNINEAYLEILHQKNDLFKEAVESKDAYRIINADADFHRYLCVIAENEYIARFCDTLFCHIARLEYTYFLLSNIGELSAHTHSELISLLADANKKAAGQMLKDGWLRSMAECERRMASRL